MACVYTASVAARQAFVCARPRTAIPDARPAPVTALKNPTARLAFRADPPYAARAAGSDLVSSGRHIAVIKCTPLARMTADVSEGAGRVRLKTNSPMEPFTMFKKTLAVPCAAACLGALAAGQ